MSQYLPHFWNTKMLFFIFELLYFFSLINADQCFSYVMNCDDIIRLLPDLDHI